MKIVIPFESPPEPKFGEHRFESHGHTFCGSQVRELITVKKERTYKLKSFFITTSGFTIVSMFGPGAGQSEDFSYIPTGEVLGIELPMPEWVVEPGQSIRMTLYNHNAAQLLFGGYFIGEIVR
jgi:hypothetical protein